MTVEISYSELRYDPSIARAAVRRNGSDWAVVLEHADSTPVHRLIISHEEIAIEVGAAEALNHDAVMGFIEQRLSEAGYSAVREGGDFPNPFIGALQLGPKE
jgi:hypothetical protein